MNKHDSERSYYKAFYGTIISYSIIIFKSHGNIQISKAYVHRLMMDENTHYLLLAISWLTHKAVWVSLLPFATFSLFHALTYTRTHFIPVLFPATASPLAWSRRISQLIGQFVSQRQASSLKFVADIEVFLILPYLFLACLTFRASFVSLILYANFLRFRCFFSTATAGAFSKLRHALDKYIGLNESVPSGLRKVYTRARDLAISFGSVENKPASNKSE